MQTASITQFPELSSAELAEALGHIVGAEHIHLGETRRRMHSEDIWQPAGAIVALVAAPGSTDETARIVRAIHQAGFAIAPRGRWRRADACAVPLQHTQQHVKDDHEKPLRSHAHYCVHGKRA